jgi:hypothetical protein
MLIKLTVRNYASSPKILHLLPTLWVSSHQNIMLLDIHFPQFRNTWSWGCKHDGCTMKPTIRLETNQNGEQRLIFDILTFFLT